MGPSELPRDWWNDTLGRSELVARNIVAEYLAIAVSLGLGLVMLPFNLKYLGQSNYGLWVLATSVITYFSILDLGYGSAQVKFAAQYRARRDAGAINEVVSTLFFMFAGVALVAYAGASILAMNLGRIFNLNPQEAALGRDILMIVSLNLALQFPFSVYGGVVNGFQRYYTNNVIALVTSVLVAAVNVAVLMAGYGLLTLVTATTAVRLLALLAYRFSAYRAFPLLNVSWKNVRRGRLREVTGFSVYLLIINMAAKINFTADTMVIGMFMSPAAIAVWAVAHRLTDISRMLTGVLTHFLFPTIVNDATENRIDRLRQILLEGTRISLATVIPLASVTAVLAPSLVLAWVGPRMAEAIPIIYVLSAAVIIRTSNMTARSVLKGAGQHRSLAWWSVAGALGNLALSIVLVKRFGLVGVAFGTVIPMLLINELVVFPAACRRVEVNLHEAVRYAVWPAVWPAVLPCLALYALRPAIGTNVLLIVLSAVAAGIAYALIFGVFAIKRGEREWYMGRIRAIAKRPRVLLPV